MKIPVCIKKTEIKCLQGEEARFRHMLLQMNAGAKVRPNAIQQRIDTLNERFTK
jgi:hypothetical protein